MLIAKLGRLSQRAHSRTVMTTLDGLHRGWQISPRRPRSTNNQEK